MTSHEVRLSGMPSERFRIGSSWGLGNNLMVFPAPATRAPDYPDSGSSFGGSNSAARIQNIRWETTLYDPIFRKLVNESLHVFLNLQKMSRDDEGDL